MTTISTSETSVDICGEVGRLLDRVEGEILVSQNRWVDNLLDLYNMTESWSLRRLIEDTLADLRYVRSVEGPWLHDRLSTMAAALEIELAFGPEATLSA